jgi:hypothetical protein
MSELALLSVVLMMLGCAVAMGAMTLMAWRGMRHAGVEVPEQRLAPAPRRSARPLPLTP